jgi:hypothetical protein
MDEVKDVADDSDEPFPSDEDATPPETQSAGMHLLAYDEKQLFL